MGKRVLRVDGRVLLDMMKQGYPGGARYYAVIENALPDDTRLVGYEVPDAAYSMWASVDLILESAEWFGDARHPELSPPVMQSHHIVLPDGGG